MSLTARAHKTLMIKVFAAFSTYGFSVFLARVMAPEAFGLVAFFLNAAILLSVVGACGQQMALIRFVPTFAGRAQGFGLWSFVARSALLASAGTVLTFGLVVPVAILWPCCGSVGGETATLIILGFALIPAVGLADYLAHLARGFHLIQLSLIPKEILWRAVAALLIAFAMWSGTVTKVEPEFVLTVLLATLLFLASGQYLWLHRLIKQRVAQTHGATPTDKWRRTIGPFWLTSVSNIFLANADVVIVGLVLGTENAAYYFAANRLAMLLAFFTTSFNVVIGPMLSEAWQNGDASGAQTIVQAATLKTSLPTIIAGGLLIAAASPALLLFGPNFVVAAPALQILLVAGILNAVFGPADIALNMCGHEKAAMRVSAISLGFNATMLLVGAALGGTLGVALAVLAGTALRKGLFWRLALQHMSLRTDLLASLAGQRPSTAVSGR